MKRTQFPLPKKYWLYVGLTAVLAVCLFLNIFWTDDITGEKEFWDYTAKNWLFFAAFLMTEILLGIGMHYFAVKAGRISKQRDEQFLQHYYAHIAYQGIKPGEYDFVWFDYSGEERALIMKNGSAFLLYVQSVGRDDCWHDVNTVSRYESLDKVKQALFYEFDFYCEHNAMLDRYGDEVFIGSGQQ